MPHHARPLPLGLDEYELILDSLKGMDYEIRRDILQAMCLTHRSLVPLCQKRLFSTIKFSSKKADAFLNILSASPYLADYIRNLTLNLQLDKEQSPTNSQDVTNTAQCLEKLNNLISLTVLGRRDWHTIDLQISNAILRLMLSPNLNTLGLRDLQNFPRHGLSSLKQSQYLNFISFGAITIGPPATVGLPSTRFEFDNTLGPANPTSAQIASFSGSADAIDALVGGPGSRCRSEPVFDFTRLRSLYSELGSIPDAEANNMLIGRSPCLEDVFCTIKKHSRATFKGIAAAILKGSCRTLRKLTLFVVSPTTDEDADDDPFYGSSAEVMQLIGRMESLATLKLHFYYDIDDVNELGHICQTIKRGCINFDAYFSDHRAFARLSSLVILFVLNIHRGRLVDVNDTVGEQHFAHLFTQYVKHEAFKNLQAISRLALSFEVEIDWPEGDSI